MPLAARANICHRHGVTVLRSLCSLYSTSPSNINNNLSGFGPPPIRVAVTASAGRGVFATRPITAGDLIHTAKPFLVHPNAFLSHKVCYSCLRWLGRNSLPGHIKGAYFCGQDCKDQSEIFYEVERKADWQLFDNLCRTRGLKYPYVVKRMACMVISGATPSDSLDILQPASLYPEQILQMEEEFNLLKETLTKAQIEEEKMAFLTKNWYVNVLARIRINAFRVELVTGSYEDLLSSAYASVESAAAAGNAIYMLPSFYNHDCDPNTHIIWIDNAEAKLKALRNIDEGEELRICYIDASMDVEARKSLLSQGFGFDCQCLRCTSGD